MTEKRDILSIYGEYGGVDDQQDDLNNGVTPSESNRPAVQAFSENDILKNIGLARVEDEMELKRLLRPTHRDFLRKLHNDELNDTSASGQLESDEALIVRTGLDASRDQHDALAVDRGDSVIDYLESLSPDSELMKVARAANLTNGDSSASKVTPIGHKHPNDMSNSIAIPPAECKDTSQE